MSEENDKIKQTPYQIGEDDFAIIFKPDQTLEIAMPKRCAEAADDENVPEVSVFAAAIASKISHDPNYMTEMIEWFVNFAPDEEEEDEREQVPNKH